MTPVIPTLTFQQHYLHTQNIFCQFINININPNLIQTKYQSQKKLIRKFFSK